MNITKFTAIGSIVANKPHAAGIFNHYGIDFYSQGKRSLENACLEENLPVVSLLEELYALKDAAENSPDFPSMTLRTLSTYILRTHHRFTEKKLVFIKKTLSRLMWNTTDLDAKMIHLNKRFEELSVYLTVHMKHEEFIIFPSIQALERRGSRHLASQTIQNLIKSMVEDHRYEVMTLKSLAELTNNYVAPPNADYALTITYSALRELEEDLRIHMHLENNILFPKTGALIDAEQPPVE